MTAFPWPVQEAGGAAAFVADLPFALDDFQHEAFDALDAGHSVLVSAPTGLGQDAGRRLRASTGPWAPGARPSTPRPSRPSRTRSSPSWSPAYGEEHVGLLTGDTTLRPGRRWWS